MLTIKNYSKIYKGNKKAVDNLSLTVEAGDIYGFIGHNGAGKTTTLRAVVGVLDFEEGDILIDGVSITKDPVGCKKKMAYIPDNPDLYEHLTGIAYLNFIGDLFEVEKKERENRIKMYGDMFEITGNFGDAIASYSHGMKQKLAIISALIHEPKLMILDEPFVGLDPKAAHQLKQVMAQMCQNGSAIFFSTHVLEVAEKMCNKIAIIKGGKLIASGTTSEVKGNQSLEEVFMELIEE
ncbi:MAG TPA: ABC transporter ATP-binding protein [Lachnoclostridium phytofermentans]|uniref:ABC transporter ATP-binding protein n=1 Tax=Lachnoclostridium phytofermentans TaxID=66219 RepID=A0A3D2X548_9FIRM|nr:ABC transporter ATP-binding protein [Lachnoclostridium sp.]HCL01837.1 ABC transporter ATP-binding protein [Lachnoclostridium phytofermentans]